MSLLVPSCATPTLSPCLGGVRLAVPEVRRAAAPRRGALAACSAAVAVATMLGRRSAGSKSHRDATPRSQCTRMMAAEQGATTALLFDCDGVIVETEDLHLETYNLAFDDLATDVKWSATYYQMLQNTVGGGKAKMRYHFERAGWPGSKLGPPPATEAEMDELIDTLQARKTKIYQDKVAEGALGARDGILDLIDQAHRTPGLQTAICSASTKSAVQKVLVAVLGQERLDRFGVLLLGDDVAEKKPNPLIYQEAAKRLGVDAADCAVIEDSKIGLQAALGAGMSCYITTTASTEDQDFTGAARVVTTALDFSLEELLRAKR